MNMNSITFNNTRYHLNGAMEEWCREQLGQGKWIGNRLVTWEGMEPNVWTIESMFGNTTFSFKEDKDFTWFLLRWS
jgi:hypothetical protein